MENIHREPGRYVILLTPEVAEKLQKEGLKDLPGDTIIFKTRRKGNDQGYMYKVEDVAGMSNIITELKPPQATDDEYEVQEFKVRGGPHQQTTLAITETEGGVVYQPEEKGKVYYVPLLVQQPYSCDPHGQPRNKPQRKRID